MVNGQPSKFKFTAYSGTKWEKTNVHLISKKISLARQSGFKVGDEVLSYWDSDVGRVMPYH